MTRATGWPRLVTRGALALCLLLLLCALSSPSPALARRSSESYVILDFSSADAVSGYALPRRALALPAHFGPAWPELSQTQVIDLIALPLSNDLGCSLPSPDDAFPALMGKPHPLYVLVRRGGCTFADKAHNMLAAGARGMIVVSSANESVSEMFLPPELDATYAQFRGAMLSHTHGEPLIAASLGDLTPADTSKAARTRPIHPKLIGGVRAHLYERDAFDAAFLLMTALATGVVMLGAWLSSSAERRASSVRSGVAPADAPAPGEGAAEVQTLSTRHAVGFILLASAMLVVLFFLIRWLIYVIVLAFALSAVQALTLLGAGFLRWVRPSERRTFVLPMFGETSLYTILSFVSALVLTASWVATRNRPGSWVLQDVLGVAILIMIQQSLRLPDIKVSAVLLSLAFVYDVFWVFLSGYIFKESVMMAVASGGGTGEAVPMLLRMPRLGDELGGFSMLGLGDIALPGLLVSYLLRFDYSHPQAVARSWYRSYFAVASGGYAAGLVCTYIALIASGSGQPALLYLVPCTLFVVMPLAWVRGDLKEMWHGSPSETTRSAATPRVNGRYAAVAALPEESDEPSTTSIASASEDTEEREMMDSL